MQFMNDLMKKEIVALLNNYVQQYPSQKKAVDSLKGISEATVISMRKDNWANISDDMWRSIGNQVGYNKKGTWSIVETTSLQTFQLFYKDAKDYSNVYAITAPAGSGKSASAQYLAQNTQNVYHLVCADYFNRKMFLSKLLSKMGKDDTGYNVSEMMDYVVELLRKQDCPLIILDEADKLNDQVLYFFITLYNMLQGKCAIVLLATDFLEKRIIRGVKLNKKGYAEIYSRIGRKFLRIEANTKKEVTLICQANGVTDVIAITEIFNESDGDLRRVERAVHKHIKLQSKEVA